MKNWLKSPQTVIGALIALVGVAGLWFGKFASTEAITIIGIAAVWIGVTGKDANK
jgi:hypothetical protein